MKNNRVCTFCKKAAGQQKTKKAVTVFLANGFWNRLNILEQKTQIAKLRACGVQGGADTS